MNPEDVGKILDELGQRIGPYGDAAWRIAVDGERVSGIINTIIAAGILVAGLIVGRAMWRKGTKLNTPPSEEQRKGYSYYSSWHSGDGDGWQMASGFVMGAGVVVGIIGLSFSLQSVFIPEYVVLKQLLSLGG